MAHYYVLPYVIGHSWDKYFFFFFTPPQIHEFMLQIHVSCLIQKDNSHMIKYLVHFLLFPFRGRHSESAFTNSHFLFGREFYALPDTILYFIRPGDWHRETQTRCYTGSIFDFYSIILTILYVLFIFF